MRLLCPKCALPLFSALAVLVGLGQPASAQSVSATITADRAVYQKDDTLRVAVDVANTGAAVTGEIYAFLRLPGSERAVSLVKGVPVFDGRYPRPLRKAMHSVRLTRTAPVHLDFEYAWKGSEPIGTYRMHVVVVRPGSLADGQFSPSELLATATGSFVLKLPLVEDVQSGARSEALIEPEGGQVSAVGSQGAIYTLAVPPGALTQATPIAITPVSAIGNLPLSGSLSAAVRLEPSGLTFNQPLTLDIQVPGGVSTQGLLGFLYSGTGENFEVLPVQLNGAVASVQVAHFSTAGLASGSPADFIAQVGPLVAALPPTLPVGQVEELTRLLLAWVDRFGLDLCNGSIPSATTVCNAVYQKGLDSLTLNVAQACAQTEAQLAAQEPFAAFNGLSPVVKLIGEMAALNNVGESLGLAAIQSSMPELACVPTRLSSIIAAAEAEGQSKLMLAVPSGDPSAPFITMMDAALLLLRDIGANGALLGRIDIQNAASAAIGRLMSSLLDQAGAQCATQPLVADALLFRPLQLFGADALNGLSSSLGRQFEIAAAGCRVAVTPPGATVGPTRQVQFSATFADPDGIGANFVWQLDSNCAGTVTADGLFTAGPTDAVCELTAGVPPGGPLATRRPFFKTVTVTTKSAVVITARSVSAAKNLRAGTSTGSFFAGPFNNVLPRIAAEVFAQTVNSTTTDPNPGVASVTRSRVELGVDPALENRVITGTGTMGASTEGDAQASVTLASGLTADLQGTFNCQLQVTTSAAGRASAFSVRLVNGAGTVFTATASGSLTAVCGPGVYVLDVNANVALGEGPASASRTFSYTLTLTPSPAP